MSSCTFILFYLAFCLPLLPSAAVFHLSESSPITAAWTTLTASGIRALLCLNGMMTTSVRPAALWADVAVLDRSVLVQTIQTGIAFNVVFVSCMNSNIALCISLNDYRALADNFHHAAPSRLSSFKSPVICKNLCLLWAINTNLCCIISIFIDTASMALIK